MKEIRITKNEENQRLDKFLLKYMNKASKAFIYKMLRKKRIKYNGKKAEGSELLRAGDSLSLYLSEETMCSFMEEKAVAQAKRHFAIVFEDDDVLAVAKPAGLLTHPEKSEDKDTLIDQVLFYLYEKGQYAPSMESTFTPALCNRLDRNTSGIVLAGKTLKGVQSLNEAIRNKQVDKYYLTLVQGEVKQAGEISAFLSKEEGKNQVRISKEAGIDGKESITRYRPLAYQNGYTLLEIHLITGKTHQIRAHMQAMGHPVVGDRKYGDTAVNQEFRQNFGLSNQFLHGARLVFSNTDGFLSYLKGKTLIAPLPKVFQQIVEDIFGESVALE
ncbi:RluA family pseudouridine synthase [Anaerotignum propionicum]|uniref:Pseudouridine synthase n=1 Tax=Anaerotignum propionicum DSM 1682 TaxID=991789 RepID=A0A0X8VBR3_ANAPI|nr:RluA family pseudouridine synthase [Anaerotignum propionicum]AMJ39855.1 ribosomal large subunit pseudouridine synthase C [Anaerotignum propionicum DSM 1682]SHE27813.1 23S rRNA pseudouridine955/2504/2580 synthase [[Clostridium] propionicum DSM 1682] [Anaerotignum propionicum DSM 1682]HBF65054.1 RluA family pseudouridine synthase [Clostridium sp.]